MYKAKLLKRYVFFDLMAAMLVWLLFMIYRKTVNDAQLFPNVPIFLSNYNFISGFLYFPLSCVFIHYLSGIYVQPSKVNTAQTFLSTFVSSVIVSFVIFFALMLDDKVVSYLYYYYSLAVLFALLFLITLIPRLTTIVVVKKKYLTHKWSVPTLIIGTGQNASETSKNLSLYSIENQLLGFVDIHSRNSEKPKFVKPALVLGKLSDLDKLISKHSIKDVIVSLDDDDSGSLYKIVHSLYHYDIDIRFTPRLNDILTGGPRIKMMGKVPLVNITDLNIPFWQLSVKRFLDILVSSFGLLILSPLMLFFMLRIKQDSEGPVLYGQERIGMGGKPFRILKFRTMYVGSENGIPQLSSDDDPRITPLGKVMRKYRFDELPQLWNILKGDMSIVGPRPERKYFIEQIIEQAPYYCLLYKVRPGLTSWGPVKVGYTDTIEKMIERLHYDIIYMENMSLWIDVKIVIQTIEILIKGKGV